MDAARENIAEPVLSEDGGTFWKAHIATEGDERIMYAEASNENLDAQRERVLKDALLNSREHYLRFGNIDLDHLTLIGVRLGMTPDEARLQEIGVPIDVQEHNGSVCVKGSIYRGEGLAARTANLFWDSQQTRPPRPFFPSVGGRTLDFDSLPDGTKLVKSVIWSNLGLAREPVNRTVKAVSLIPLDAFVKSRAQYLTALGGAEVDLGALKVAFLDSLEFAKAVTAGYGTDSATMTGGRAVQLQSIHGHVLKQTLGGDTDADYPQKATRFLKAYTSPWMTPRRCAHTMGDLSLKSVTEHFEQCEGTESATAGRYAHRLLSDLQGRLKPQRYEHTAAAAA